MGGNLTLVVLDHMGPENPENALKPIGFNANAYMRYYNDAVLTWKASDALTFATELSWVRDDFDGFYTSEQTRGRQCTYGIATYMSYTLGDTVTFNARGEVLRDDNGFFCCSLSRQQRFRTYPRRLSGRLAAAIRERQHRGRQAYACWARSLLGLTFKPSLPARLSPVC